MSEPARLHTRTIRIETRPRPDGRLALRAELRDDRHVDLPEYMGFEHPSGVVHHMAFDAELDGELVIRSLDAQMMTAPFAPSDRTRGEGCRHILPAYDKLVGLRMDPEYPLRVLEAVGGRAGCFHLLSLAQCLPAAVRAATRRLCAGARRQPATARESVLDSCAAWRAGGDAWREVTPEAGNGFGGFRREIRIDAHAAGGMRLRMRGDLRDEPAEGAVQTAALELELELPRFTITRAEARLDPEPFAACPGTLVGLRDLHHLSIHKGFTAAALEKIGGGAGCAHLFALVVAITPVSPQAAGALAGFLGMRPDQHPREGRKNPQVDSCHMWRSDGPLTSL